MKYNTEEIGKTILKERKRLGLTQKGLGEKLGLVGKQISAYEKGDPTPPISVMLKLCEVFDCELGYLLGEPEYSEGTAARTTVHNLTGLSDKAMDNILTVTGSEDSDLAFSVGLHQASFRRALDSFLSSDGFIPLMERLQELDELSTAEEYAFESAKAELGEELYDFAINNLTDSIEDWYEEHPGETLNDDQCEAMSRLIGIINSFYGWDYRVKVARFEAAEAFVDLIRKLYPGKKRIG